MTSDLHASLKEVILLNEFIFRLGNKTWFPLVMSAQNTSADRSWQFQHMFAGLKLKASFFSRVWNHEDNGITVQIKGWSIIAFLWTSLVGTTYKSQSKTWNLMSFHITADLSNCFIGLLPLCIASLSRNVVSWDKLLKKLFCHFWSLVSNVEGSA